MVKTYYEKQIEQDLAKIGRTDVPARFVEEQMRAHFNALSNLDAATFRKEARVNTAVWDLLEPNEKLAYLT